MESNRLILFKMKNMKNSCMLVFVAVVVCCSIFFTFTSIQTVIKAGETNAAEMKSSEATEEGKQLIVKKAETADAAANAKEKEVIHINTTAAGAGLLLIEDELVKLDNNSTLAPDIINITHVRNGNEEESNMIVIHLKQERRCKTPQLVGRLSGPALSKVTWEKVHEDDHEAF
jgi:NhaP-type Na+/H+ or K+/H+ antiporter